MTVMIDTIVGGLRISARFCSGNLASMEGMRPLPALLNRPLDSPPAWSPEAADGSFLGRTRADNAGTPQVSGFLFGGLFALFQS
jgi:hypothetical protein